MYKNFITRLKSLRGNKTQREFAELIGIPLKSYEHYEAGRRKPTVGLILQIVRSCDVSADWTLGISDAKNKITATNSNVSSPHGAVSDSTGRDSDQISDIYKEVIAHERQVNEFLQKEIERLTALLESRKE